MCHTVFYFLEFMMQVCMCVCTQTDTQFVFLEGRGTKPDKPDFNICGESMADN